MHINYQFNNNNYKSTDNHDQFKVFSESNVILSYSLIIYNHATASGPILWWNICIYWIKQTYA